MKGWTPVLCGFVCTILLPISAGGAFLFGENDLERSDTWSTVLSTEQSHDVIDTLLSGVLMQMEPTERNDGTIILIIAPPAMPAEGAARHQWSSSPGERGVAMVAVPLPPAIQAGGLTLLAVIVAGTLTYLRHRRLR